jgi:hypothetical protein
MISRKGEKYYNPNYIRKPNGLGKYMRNMTVKMKCSTSKFCQLFALVRVFEIHKVLIQTPVS